MPDPEETPPLSPGAFGRALHEFLEVSLALAPPEDSELTNRLREHLGVEHLGDVPIQSRDLTLPDHPTLQVGLDHLVASGAWEVEIVGVRASQAAMFGAGLTLALFAAGSIPGMRFAAPPDGPVERVSIALEPGESVACLVNVLLFGRRADRP